MFVIIAAVVIFVICCLFLEKIIRSIKVNGFAQKHVFITGCDSGFGQKLAMNLDRLGFPVFAGCLTDDGQKFLSENASSRLITLSLDVSKPESIQKALDFVKQKLPFENGLWAIVNNAGIFGPPVPTEVCRLEDLHKVFAVNICGPFEMCRRFLPLLRKSNGRVVNMASVMGRISLGSSPYVASKFAMEGFSDTLRREIHAQGIKVSIIEPGMFFTGLLCKETFLNHINNLFKLADEEVQSVYGNIIDQASDGIDLAHQTANRKLHLVVDAYTHAIVSRFPKTRYVVGLDARVLFAPISNLPGGVSDWILNTLQKLT